MKKKYLIAFSLFMVVLGTFSQGTIKIYPYKMEVTNHPDHFRHYVKAPSDSLFGNKVHFISLRNLDGSDFRNRIDQWVNKFKLGDIMWVSYPLIYQKNLKEVVAEIKKRNLYLFDLWGYIPGMSLLLTSEQQGLSVLKHCHLQSSERVQLMPCSGQSRQR